MKPKIKSKKKKKPTIGQGMLECLQKEQRGQTHIILMIALNDPLGGEYLADPRIPPHLLKQLFDVGKTWADTLIEVKPGYWMPANESPRVHIN